MEPTVPSFVHQAKNLRMCFPDRIRGLEGARQRGKDFVTEYNNYLWIKKSARATVFESRVLKTVRFLQGKHRKETVHSSAVFC